MKKSRSNGFLGFVFALIPGADEMYMGFMKMGLSIMAIFFGLIFIPAFFGLQDVFVLLPIVVWFYSFFHARNLWKTPEEEFEMLGDYPIWQDFTGETQTNVSKDLLKRVIGWGAIVLGGVAIYRTAKGVLVDYLEEILRYEYSDYWYALDALPRIIFAIIIIVLGIILLKGKKVKKDGK